MDEFKVEEGAAPVISGLVLRQRLDQCFAEMQLVGMGDKGTIEQWRKFCKSGAYKAIIDIRPDIGWWLCEMVDLVCESTAWAPGTLINVTSNSLRSITRWHAHQPPSGDPREMQPWRAWAKNLRAEWQAKAAREIVGWISSNSYGPHRWCAASYGEDPPPGRAAKRVGGESL